jgi:hypothetical protein
MKKPEAKNPVTLSLYSLNPMVRFYSGSKIIGNCYFVPLIFIFEENRSCG